MGRRCIHPSILKIFFPYCCHIQWQSLGNSCPTKISLSHQLKSAKETVLKPSPCHPFSSYSHPLLTPSLFFLFSSKESAWVSDQIHILIPTFPRSGSSLIFSTPRCQSRKLQWKIHNSCLSVVGGGGGCPIQYWEHTWFNKLVIYLKFKFCWVSAILSY